MDILIVGLSNVVLQRLLPALLRIDTVGMIHVASNRREIDIPVPAERLGRVFHGYEIALRELAPCLAYISLPNHLHAQWASRALESGFHVIVDKPAFLKLHDAQTLLERAAYLDLCLAEATVWPWHPQVAAAQEEFDRAAATPSLIQVAFSFPRPAAANFRNDPLRGGGALNDLGAYAVSTGRVFLPEDPVEIWCRCLARDAVTQLDLAFAISAVYAVGAVYQGFFSFGTEYRNSISLLGPGLAVTMDPAFTTPLDSTQHLRVRSMSENRVVEVAGGNAFGSFVNNVIDAIKKHNWSAFSQSLWKDALLLDMAARQAGIERYAN